jgi:hypothetical protein
MNTAQRLTQRVPNFVYLIRETPRPKSPHAFYKIGKSCNPDFRCRQLQSGNPHKLQLIAFAPYEDADEKETELHYKYAKFQVINEWFKLSNFMAQGLEAELKMRMIFARRENWGLETTPPAAELCSEVARPQEQVPR